MENVHSAIAWYQKKIGSYDKQLWEQSVERKLQKGLPNVHHAPRKTVRLKTEYIDVDLIRGSTFTKTKPQVPWIYITRKAFVRVLFFPFYYKWWVHQTSWSTFMVLLFLYTLQVITSIVYFRNVDGSIIEDELALTEVVVPISLMFLLGLIHSQTVLAHFSLKPPRRDGRLHKNKKRQRQGDRVKEERIDGERNATQGERPRSRERHGGHRVSPPRTMPVISTLWNLPQVEVSTAEQISSEGHSMLQGHSSTRPARKNVRILEQIQSYDPSTSRSSDIMQDFEDPFPEYTSVDEITASESGIVYRVGTREPSATSEPSSLKERGDTAVFRDQEELFLEEMSPRNNSNFETASTNNNSGEDGSRDAGCADVGATKGSPVKQRGCDHPEKGEEGAASHNQKDTSDSDSVAGRFEFVNMDSKGRVLSPDAASVTEVGNYTQVQASTVDVSQKLVSATKGRDDITGMKGRAYLAQIASELGDSVDAADGGCVLQRSGSDASDPLVQESASHLSDKVDVKEVRRGECTLQRATIRPAPARDGSSNSDLESLPHLIVCGLRGDRGSVSEDALDQKEEDNLSDNGHVSNSSNYNPSDSGPESDAEGDNLDDSLRLTVKKIIMPASDIATTEASSGHSSHALGPSVPPTSALPSLTSSPRKVAQQQQEGESSASEPGSPDARPSPLGGGLRRRRRPSSNQATGEQGEVTRTRPVPPKLLGLRAQNKNTQTSGISSSENEAGRLSPESANKATISSEEWEDRMQSDMTTSSSYSTSNSESELSENENMEEEEDDPPGGVFPGISLMQPPIAPNAANTHCVQPDQVSCVIWEGNECKKVDLTALDIGWAIIDKVDNLPESSDYILIGLVLAICLGCVPLAYRLYFAKNVPLFLSWQFLDWLWVCILSSSWRQHLLIINGVIQRFMLSSIFFFLLTVTDRTFKQRLLYAKHFSYLTSSRRARKFDMPHFRLSKVRNIKIWLSLRSYLKRRGPQRSVDVIVSASFYSSISLVCLMCIQMLKDTDTYLDYLCNWELVVWCMALGIYMMRFMTLGLKINKKYRNLSVLITEQINLYLQMEQKPHKKEELTLANNVLRLAEDLLKELESPFKISGFSANPLIYNITKVVVLSAFSAVMTELLGFKLKLYKIKLKA